MNGELVPAEPVFEGELVDEQRTLVPPRSRVAWWQLRRGSFRRR